MTEQMSSTIAQIVSKTYDTHMIALVINLIITRYTETLIYVLFTLPIDQ